MADGLEEPGWPASLTPKQTPVEVFANAFQHAAAINVQKQHLQQQLAAMQADTLYKNQQHDLEMQKFGWQQKYQMAELNRQYAADLSLATARDRAQTRLEDGAYKKISEMDAEQENASKYDDALTGWMLKYPETYANQEATNEKTLIDNQFTAVAGTKSGKAVTARFDNRIKAAQAVAHQTAKTLSDNLDFSLEKQGSQGLNRTDLDRPSDAFQLKDNKYMIYEKPIWASGTPGVGPVGQWATVPPDEVSKLSQADQTTQGIRVRSSPKNSWDSIQKTYTEYRKFAGQDLNKTPAPTKQYPALPSSKDQLSTGTIYQTNRGPARWNGAAFESTQ